MRRMVTASVLIGALAAGAGVAACGGAAAGDRPGAGTGPSSAGAASSVDDPPGTRETEIYVEVLRRYLGTPSENSFAEPFPTVFVLDRAHPDAAESSGGSGSGVAIPADVQRRIAAAVPNVTFIADPSSVIKDTDSCPQVRDHGILITFGTIDGDGPEVRVPINGYVACLGATWLTYVVGYQAGTGWRVTGTTGSIAIA